MAIYKNTPPIITSGLTLYLDAANSKSYVTGSTRWNDLGGLRNSGSLVSGSGFSTDGGGSITFPGSTAASVSNFPIQTNIYNTYDTPIYKSVSALPTLKIYYNLNNQYIYSLNIY
jgi:hypothetical protein